MFLIITFQSTFQSERVNMMESIRETANNIENIMEEMREEEEEVETKSKKSKPLKSKSLKYVMMIIVVINLILQIYNTSSIEPIPGIQLVGGKKFASLGKAAQVSILPEGIEIRNYLGSINSSSFHPTVQG